MCVVCCVEEITVTTEMTTSDYAYFPQMPLPEILISPINVCILVKGVIIVTVCLMVSI